MDYGFQLSHPTITAYCNLVYFQSLHRKHEPHQQHSLLVFTYIEISTCHSRQSTNCVLLQTGGLQLLFFFFFLISTTS